MIKLFIILIGLLFLISLGARVLGLFGEHPSTLPIFKTQAWATMKIPVIVFAVIIGITVLIVLISRTSKEQERKEKEFAHSQGWIYTESYNDPQGLTQELKSRLEKVCPEKEFDVRNNMSVESGRPNVFLFDCWYRVRDWGPKENLGFACLIESDRLASVDSQVDITERNSVDGLLLSHQVDMGDTEFTRNFIVTSKNPVLAKRVLCEPLQAVLLETRSQHLNYREINIGPGGVVILTGGNRSFEEWLLLIDLARRMESAFELF